MLSNALPRPFILNLISAPLIVFTKSGAVNWAFPSESAESAEDDDVPAGEPSEPSATGLPISSLIVNDLAIKNGVVLWMDQSTNTRNEVSAINLTIKDVSLDHPVLLSLSALIDNRPVSIKG